MECLRGRKGRKYGPSPRKGKKQSPEHIAALSEARKNSAATLAHCKTIAALGVSAAKAKWDDPEFRAAMITMRTGKKRSPESCANIRAARIGKRLSPEVKAARLERMRQKREKAGVS